MKQILISMCGERGCDISVSDISTPLQAKDKSEIRSIRKHQILIVL
jgi:hypothetical protein